MGYVEGYAHCNSCYDNKILLKTTCKTLLWSTKKLLLMKQKVIQDTFHQLGVENTIIDRFYLKFLQQFIYKNMLAFVTTLIYRKKIQLLLQKWVTITFIHTFVHAITRTIKQVKLLLRIPPIISKLLQNKALVLLDHPLIPRS